LGIAHYGYVDGDAEAAADDAAARVVLAMQAAEVSTTQAPYNGVVKIYDRIGNEEWQGSGVLISPDEVLTASHVVYTEGIGVATDVQVYPGSEGAYQPYGEIAGSVAHYNPVDDSGDMITEEASEQDYAIIHLAQPVTGVSYFAPLSNFTGGAVTVSGYPQAQDGDQADMAEQVALDPYVTLLDGPSLGPGSSGGPVWVTGADGLPYVAGIVSSYDGTVGGTGFNVQLTTTVFNQIESWVAQDDGAASLPLSILDTSNNQAFDPHPTAYVGPVAGLNDQYISITSDNLNATGNSGNWFIHTGAGEDAIAVHGTTDVLDGGTGSNFLVGGSGLDTFFTDDREATAPIWDTLVGFHGGDAATIFGVTQAGFNLVWTDGLGAAGYTGLTLDATSAGKPDARVTLAGFTSAALTDGQLTISYGTTDGSPYMYIHANF